MSINKLFRVKLIKKLVYTEKSITIKHTEVKTANQNVQYILMVKVGQRISD